MYMGILRFAPTSPAACGGGLVAFGAFSPVPAGRVLASEKALKLCFVFI